MTDVAVREQPTPADVAAVRELVDGTGFFSADEVRIAAELVSERLERGLASGYEFVFVEERGRLQGYSCYGHIDGTAASWDLYWIAVRADLHGRGLGRRILQLTEERIARRGGGRVYAETSGREQYAPTREFYERVGFARAAELPEFYGPGDAKVFYCKVV